MLFHCCYICTLSVFRPWCYCVRFECHGITRAKYTIFCDCIRYVNWYKIFPGLLTGLHNVFRFNRNHRCYQKIHWGWQLLKGGFSLQIFSLHFLINFLLFFLKNNAKTRKQSNIKFLRKQNAKNWTSGFTVTRNAVKFRPITFLAISVDSHRSRCRVIICLKKTPLLRPVSQLACQIR